MLEPQSNEGKQSLGWGYSILEGLYMKGLNNPSIFGHTGGDPGAFTIVLANPEKKTGLVIFMNQGFRLDIRAANTYMLVKRLVKEASL